MNLLKVILFFTFLIFLKLPVYSQSPVFYHLSTAEGLSDNNVNNACIDKKGMLWIASSEGLNSFDGNRISSFHKYNYPAMVANNIDDIVADKYDNLWLKTRTASITMLDENRNFQLFTVGDSTNAKPVKELYSTSIGMIAIKNGQQFICSKTATGKFEKLNFPLQDILPSSINFVSNFSTDKIIFYGDNRMLVVDYTNMQLLLDLPIKNIIGAAAINQDELLAYTVAGDVFYRISIAKKNIVKEYRNLRDQHQKPMENNLRHIARIDSARFVLSSRFSGLYFLDLQQETLEHITHDPLDQRSIGGNNTYRVRYDSSGYLLVTTQTSGLHYYNTKHQQAESKSYFINDRSEIFDGYIQAIHAAKDSVVWMGAQDRLIRWNRKNEVTDYISCRLPDGKNISKEETIRALHIDEKENLWVGTTRFGILVLNKQFKTIAQITNEPLGTKPSLGSGWINAIRADKKGNYWVATLRGVHIVDKNNFSVQSFKNHPVLSPVSTINCVELWIDSKDRIWMGCRTGVYCYDEASNSLKHFTTKNGLANNTVHAINEDNYGNIYFGTSGGLSILLKDGSIRSYNRNNGLKNDKCEGILKDQNGFLWIGNLNCILRYDPVNRTFAVFEEGYGFSHSGFRMRSCFKSQTGEMFWGSDKGLTWFYPGQMNSVATKLNPSVNTLQTDNGVYRFTGKSSINLPYNSSSFVFQFASGEITGGKKIQYKYRMEGFDNDWEKPIVTAQVSFNKLPPGKYNFKIKASRDGINWFDGAYPIEIIIAKAWWQQRWFQIIYITAALLSLWVLYNHFRKRKKVKEALNRTKMQMMELNVKIAESKFLNLRLQMNPHFLFNALSSIQVLIVSNKTKEAYRYLNLFSNFLRSLLNYAEKNFMPLEEELKVLKMYMELESLRFDKSFSFEINIDENLTNDEVLVPSLMIQPFVENAIWHGLLHKDGEKKLSVNILDHEGNYLTCIIEDNGVGREAAALIQKNNLNANLHESKGIAIIRERLSLLQQKTGKPAHVEITDLYNQHTEPTGTKIIITIPYYNPEES